MYFFLRMHKKMLKTNSKQKFKVLFKSVGNVQIISLSVASFVCNHIKQLRFDRFKFVNFSRFTNFSIELKKLDLSVIFAIFAIYISISIELLNKKNKLIVAPTRNFGESFTLNMNWTNERTNEPKILSNAHSLGIYCHWYVFSIRVLAISWLR